MELLSKTDLRKHFRLVMWETTSSEQVEWQAEAGRFFQNRSGLWGTYVALPGEPLCAPVQNSAIEWALPETVNLSMDYFRADHSAVEKSDLDGLLIPALAYDEQGFRLGRGGGFFDRYLKNFKGLRVGVCFEKQIVPQLPREAHDEPVDILLTEAGTREIVRRPLTATEQSPAAAEAAENKGD